MRKLVPVCYNTLVLIHVWWVEIVLKREKVYKYFDSDYPKVFYSAFTSLNKRGISQSNNFLVEKCKTSLKKSVVMHLEQLLIPNFYLTLNKKIVVFKYIKFKKFLSQLSYSKYVF